MNNSCEMWVERTFSHVSEIEQKAMGNPMAFLMTSGSAAKDIRNLINK